jgi:hypothetical protein
LAHWISGSRRPRAAFRRPSSGFLRRAAAPGTGAAARCRHEVFIRLRASSAWAGAASVRPGALWYGRDGGSSGRRAAFRGRRAAGSGRGRPRIRAGLRSKLHFEISRRKVTSCAVLKVKGVCGGASPVFLRPGDGLQDRRRGPGSCTAASAG